VKAVLPGARKIEKKAPPCPMNDRIGTILIEKKTEFSFSGGRRISQHCSSVICAVCWLDTALIPTVGGREVYNL